MKNRLLALAGGVAVTTGSFLIAETAQALTFTFGPGGEFSNSGSNLSGEVTATIQDITGGVEVSVNTDGLDGTSFPAEFISGLYLNTEPFPSNPSSVSFSTISGPAITGSIGLDSFKADGDGLFDIKIDWANQAFNADETSVFSITGGGISVSSIQGAFSAPDGGGPGPFEATLRARGLDADGEGSGWYSPVPEPLTIFGTGLALGFGGLFKKKYGQKKNQVS